jgi:20S proteasome subunit alpha 7
VEYAAKAVENGSTAIGIRCRDGVVLAFEKSLNSKLLKPKANRHIATIGKHLGAVTSGLGADGRELVDLARYQASSWRDAYKGPIPTSVMASRVGRYVQSFTLYSSLRPFGCALILAGWDGGDPDGGHVDAVLGRAAFGTNTGGKAGAPSKGKPMLYMIEPSGAYWVCISIPSTATV